MKKSFIKSGYIHKNHASDYTEDNVGTEPHTYLFAEYLAKKKGCKYIIDLGCGKAGKLVKLSPDIHIIGIDHQANIEYCKSTHKRGQWVIADLESGQLPLDVEILKQSFIICAGVIEHLLNPHNIIGLLDYMLEYAQGAIITTSERDLVHGEDHSGPPTDPHHVQEWNLTEFLQLLDSYNLKVTNSGLTYSNDRSSDKKTSIVVLENNHTPPASTTPDDFKVLAIISAYNEADVIGTSIQRLIDDGVDVYFIDNWSKDDTYKIAESFLEKGLIGLERYPPGGRNSWELTDLVEGLKRKEQIFGNSKANWHMHCDADEYRESPWPGVGMRDALYHVDQLGYNCIDYTVVNFRAVDNQFISGEDFVSFFKYFEFGKHLGYFLQLKTWKNFGQKIDLATKYGHDVHFEDKRIYPLKFLNRHYQFRSMEQMNRKVSSDRKRKGVSIFKKYNFKEDDNVYYHKKKANLTKFDENFYNEFMIERLSGIGILNPIDNQNE